MTPKQSDSELFALFKGGDLKAFESLYNTHYHSLYQHASRILDDREVAKDVIQEAFVSLYQHAQEKDIDNVGAYLYQTVRYQCFMHLRAGRISQKHIQRMNFVLLSNAVEEEADLHELEEILQERIASLPEKCRQVFYMSRFENLSNKKIASELNISLKTVEHQITKALKTLKTTMTRLAVLLLVVLPF